MTGCRFLFVLLSAAATACATTTPRSHPAFMFQGRAEDLTQLVAAANACGLANVGLALDGPDAPFVLIDIPARHDPRFDCTMRWVRDHPEAGFFQAS